MPIAYRADRTLGCTIVVWDGTVTSREMERQLRDLASDADWPAGPRHLIDATTIGTVAVPDPELLGLLYEGTDVIPDLRVAVVLDLEFASTQDVPYRTPAHEFQVAIFTNRLRACAHLGLDADAVEAVISQLRRGFEGYAAVTDGTSAR